MICMLRGFDDVILYMDNDILAMSNISNILEAIHRAIKLENHLTVAFFKYFSSVEKDL